MDTQTTNVDTDSVIGNINEWLRDILTNIGVSEQWLIYTKLIILIAVVVLLVYLLQLLVKTVLEFLFKRLHKITNIQFFEYTKQNKMPYYLALVIPYSFVINAIPIVFIDFKAFISPLIKLTEIYMVFMVIWTVMALLRSFGDVLQERPAFKNKPMRSYMQVIQIIFYILGAVVIYCILTGKSPTAFFAAMGAASAVLMLMFKDSIMGFVSSIQLSSNDMLRLGDWITMNKYGADGDVEEINLTTVKIRNFDKTITTIPTYALISDSFQNWRGMQESGARRIKRALYLKQSGIHFLTDVELDEFKKIDGLAKYITAKQEEYTKLTKKNKKVGDNTTDSPLNGLLVTNNDLFMQYCVNYLQNHPSIKQNMTLMVRQLAPTAEGLPVELYTFANTTVWMEYEMTMSEIINHLLSVVKYFDLLLYEASSGSDDYNVFLKNQDN